MGFRNIFRDAPNDILTQNEELLEEYDLINTFGSPNKLFLKFLDSKNLKITEDIITEELIVEFNESVDSINLRQDKLQKQIARIMEERKVWINIPSDDEWLGTDLFLDHEGITIQKTGEKIYYSQIDDIEMCDGGWSKKKVLIEYGYDKLIFTINENIAVALIEILEDNVENAHRDESDELLELYTSFANGEISKEEFEIRKAVIYSDDVYCTNCGQKLDSDSLFCSECGHRLI